MNKPDTLIDVVNSPTKKVEEAHGGPEGVLVRLWRTILFQRNMSYGAIDNAIRQFMENARRSVVKVGSTPTYINTNNLRRELALDKMTIKVFLKALRALGAYKITLTVTLYHKHYRSEHSIDVDLGDELFANEAPETPSGTGYED
jgi:hypothetical protein